MFAAPKSVSLRHLITKILEHFGVPLEGETKVALNRLESKVDIEVVYKMGFVIDPVTRRTYKHRTDRQPALRTNQNLLLSQTSLSLMLNLLHLLQCPLIR
ncbi:hypothetical protein Lal_00044235 [Lupinus albus]|nr:hypothetical protein Lal_00044235 [Lupinus albus]